MNPEAVLRRIQYLSWDEKAKLLRQESGAVESSTMLDAAAEPIAVAGPVVLSAHEFRRACVSLAYTPQHDLPFAPPPPPGGAAGPSPGSGQGQGPGLGPGPTLPPGLKLKWLVDNVSDGYPPDPQVAVSSSHVLITGGGAAAGLVYYEKGITPGTRRYVSFQTLFHPLGLDDGSIDSVTWGNDPRAIFDPYRMRFIVLCGGGNNDNQNLDQKRGRFAIAVSQTEDPTDGWYYYVIDSVSEWGVANSKIYKKGDVSDFPSLGVGPVAVLVTSQTMGKPTPNANGKLVSSARYERVVLLDAAAMAAGKKPYANRYDGLPQPQGGTMLSEIQPAVHHGPTSRHYLVGEFSNTALIWAIEDALKPTQKIVRVQLPLFKTNDPVLAPQDRSNLSLDMTNMGRVPLKAVFRYPFLYFCHNVSTPLGMPQALINCIHFVRVHMGYGDIYDGGAYPDTYQDQDHGYHEVLIGGPGLVYSEPSWAVHCGFPALEVNGAGDVVLVYAASASTGPTGTFFPQARYSVLRHDENSFRPSQVLQKGLAEYRRWDGTNPPRWGDTAGASVDPSDDHGVWISHEYAYVDHGYRIVIGKVMP